MAYGSRAGASAGQRSYDYQNMTEEELDMEIQATKRRMDESSSRSLRIVNECLAMGLDTSSELERQAETMDRVERTLGNMEVDLDQSKRHMRKIKSPFGGVANYFSKPSYGSGDGKSTSRSGRKVPEPREERNRRPVQTNASTGSEITDRNVEEMGKALHQLKGVGLLLGDQLDDSLAQIERTRGKVDRNQGKVKKVTRDIKVELR